MMNNMNFEVGDTVRYKGVYLFSNGQGKAIITDIDISGKVWFNNGKYISLTDAYNLLEVVKRGNDMNEQSAELLERVAQLVRKGENPVSHFRYLSGVTREYEDYPSVYVLVEDIVESPDKVEEKPQTMNLGGYEIPMPIQEEPVVGAKVFFPDLNLADVGECMYAPDTTTSDMYRQNLLHYDYKSAKDHLDVLNKLHGVG